MTRPAVLGDYADGLDVVEVLQNTLTTVHFTLAAWPMVGLFVGKTDIILEPWQAREIANRLQTIAERLVRNAANVEGQRAAVMSDPKFGGEP
jgi:hypothetical protein